MSIIPKRKNANRCGLAHAPEVQPLRITAGPHPCAPLRGQSLQRAEGAAFFLQSFVVTVKLTIVSVSRRFLKTKHCQNHEQDTWPEEFSKGKDLGELWKRLVPE